MTDASNTFVAVNGQSVRTLKLQVSAVGPWVADVDLTAAAALSGSVALTVGSTTLRGTVVPQQTSTFALQTSARIVGGAAGWSKLLTPKAYHNDAGVKAQLITQDAARECGETLGTFAPTLERVGVDFVRANEPASKVIEYAAGGAAWWVDYAGITHVGTRPTGSLAPSAYVLQQYNGRERTAQLAIDDLAALEIGSIITDERLDGPQIIHDFEVTTTNGSPLRASVWFGGLPNEAGRLGGLLRSIIAHATAGELPGIYRYRVATMNADGRVDLQAVRKQAGLPDLRSTSQWPGIAGAAITLTLGAEVLVQFIDSDPSQPVITGYVGEAGPGFVPVSIALCGSEQAAARQGDLVQSGGVGTIVTLMPVPPGVPAPPNAAVVCGVPHLISFDSVPPALAPTPIAAPLYGAVSTGSPKVKL